MALCVNAIVFPANPCRSWRSSENARHLRKYWKNVISSVREFMSLAISMMCRLNIRLGIAGASERPPPRSAPQHQRLTASCSAKNAGASSMASAFAAALPSTLCRLRPGSSKSWVAPG